MKNLSAGLAWIFLKYISIFVAVFISITPALQAQTSRADKMGGKGLVGQSGPRAPGEGKANGDQVGRAVIGQEVFRGIVLHKGQPAKDRGMIQTGLTPKFDERVYCWSVDDYWAQDYSQRMGGESLHGGIDIPAPFGTPVRAIAAGEIVQKSLHDESPDGIQIWLRHSPEDTGLPMWIFTQYAHLEKLPDLPIGQRVRMGDVIGITSNTGITAGAVRARAEGRSKGGGSTSAANQRRPAIHFAVIYNATGKYYVDERSIVPEDGRWMDPNAVYRKSAPFDSASMQALQPDQKQIFIPYMLTDGTIVPADTKRIWPYPCSTSPLPDTRRNPRE